MRNLGREDMTGLLTLYLTLFAMIGQGRGEANEWKEAGVQIWRGGGEMELKMEEFSTLGKDYISPLRSLCICAIPVLRVACVLRVSGDASDDPPL